MPPSPARYRVLKQSKIEKRAKPGAIVYGFWGHTYGVVSLDNKVTGIKHSAFTLNKNGDYPFFTMPLSDVRRVGAKKVPNRKWKKY